MLDFGGIRMLALFLELINRGSISFQGVRLYIYIFTGVSARINSPIKLSLDDMLIMDPTRRAMPKADATCVQVPSAYSKELVKIKPAG